VSEAFSNRRRAVVALAALSLGVAVAAASSRGSTGVDRGYASPTWSPDGTKIAFVEWRDVTGAGGYPVTHGTLYTMNADGTGARVVVPETAHLAGPT